MYLERMEIGEWGSKFLFTLFEGNVEQGKRFFFIRNLQPTAVNVHKDDVISFDERILLPTTGFEIYIFSLFQQKFEVEILDECRRCFWFDFLLQYSYLAISSFHLVELTF